MAAKKKAKKKVHRAKKLHQAKKLGTTRTLGAVAGGGPVKDPISVHHFGLEVTGL